MKSFLGAILALELVFSMHCTFLSFFILRAQFCQHHANDLLNTQYIDYEVMKELMILTEHAEPDILQHWSPGEQATPDAACIVCQRNIAGC